MEVLFIKVKNGGTCSSDTDRILAMADAEPSATMANEAYPDAKTMHVLWHMANHLHILSIRATYMCLELWPPHIMQQCC